MLWTILNDQLRIDPCSALRRTDMSYSKRIALAVFIVALAALPLAHAQSSRPTFEVASIKPHTPGAGNSSLQISKSRFRATGMPLKLVIRYAYDTHLPEDEIRRSFILVSGVLGIQILDGPSWVGNDRFDIEAKASQDNPGAQHEMQLMM